MLSLGMDIGTSTVKLVLLKNQEIEKQWMAVHHGNPFVCLKKGLSTLELAMDTPFSLCVTGSNTEALLEQDSAIPSLGDIPAIVEGVRWIIPQVGSVIEIGSQGARFITDLQSRAPQFAVNEHCAGGTGSFFEDQMSRVGCKLEDYSSLVEQAQSVPRLSGRCAVFAKTDIIHRQQEGATTPDILLGLCYAMIRNYKATIVRRLPVCKPVVFCGGVTCNTGVIRAIREVFGLTEEELIVPEFARYEAALGAALKASGSFTLRQLNDSLDRTLTTHHMVGTLPKLELRSGTSLAEPNATKIIPESGCALGIDIGSTSTDLVLVGADGELVDFQYLRTAGDPEGAVRKGLASIRQRFGDIRFTAVGVTGSGRERVGKRIGADAVRDEITAVKKACKGKLLKVIIETCLLTDEEKIALCKAVSDSGADYIKTSTGFSKAGATFHDVELFAAHVAPHVKIKAAGGISSIADAEEFIRLGASRLGTSRIVKLAKAMEKNEEAANDGSY